MLLLEVYFLSDTYLINCVMKYYVFEALFYKYLSNLITARILTILKLKSVMRHARF